MTEKAAPTPNLYLLTVLTDRESVQPQVNELLAATEARVVKWEDLGERQLTFKIAGRSSLRVQSVYFVLEDGQAVQEFKKKISQLDEVKRSLLTLWRDEPAKARSSRDRVGAKREA
ncbi:MAG: hypothetical protein AAB499_02725 [Patescibacteria group bacterium]